MTKDNTNSPVTEAQARKTALIVASALLLFAGWNYYRDRMTVVMVLSGLAAGFVSMGFFLPAISRVFHIYWMRIAVALGWINSRILLGLMFYCVFAPYNLIGRVFGRDPLKRRGSQSNSYWQTRKHTRQSREQFEHPF